MSARNEIKSCNFHCKLNLKSFQVKKWPRIIPITGMFLIITAHLAAQNTMFSEEFTPMWNRVRAYTLEVARAMPEEKYDYRPAPDVMTFGEQMQHIAGNLYSLNSRFVKVTANPFKPTSDTMDKKAIIETLITAFDYVKVTLDTVTDKQVKETVTLFTGDVFKKERIFYLMKDHTTHHRAQCIVYLRLNGITPPEFRGW